jgi:hypothetical protein
VGKGYYHDRLCSDITHKPFCKRRQQERKILSFNPNSWGDTFSKELTGGCRFDSSALNIASEGLLLGASLRLRVKGYLKQPLLAGAHDSKHLCTLVRITDRILQELKDARGLRAKVQTGGRNENFQSRESEDRKPEATQRQTTEGRCVSTSTCRRPIGLLKSDVLM